MRKQTRMSQSRSIVGYFCSAILIWMSAVAGYFPASASAVHSAPALSGSQHHGHSHAEHGPGGHGSVEVPDNPAMDCIATCIDLVADKVFPKVAANDWAPDQVAIPIRFGRHDDIASHQHSSVLPYWPTGPPGGPVTSGSGAARLAALNARLRI